ncbi:DUF3368 domain-containing protein [Okeania sp. SIO3B5]|uniref:DUF3368 domain-containing protein n=1 Tax=Okeania sp. SIO3B5 TaxID=2607811 RepID=UPI0025F92250|nr:DUF3368 domain-containing protein [Okeania sp. SIO3B5]
MLGVLQEAKRKGLILEIKPILDRLISENNFRISVSLYNRVLQFAGGVKLCWFNSDRS